MTASADWLPAGGRGGGGTALWVGAAAVALAVHSGAVLWSLRAPPPPPLDAGAPPAMIELIAAPASPPAEDLAMGDFTTDVPEILESAPPPLDPPAAAPDLPAPPPDLPAEPASARLTAPPAPLPEAALPPSADQPLARPRDLAPVETKPETRPETKPEPNRDATPERARQPQPDRTRRDAPSEEQPAQQARSRAAAPNAPAAGRPAAASARTGAGGASAARWRERLMAHLARRKRYPASSRARGVEGTAIVRFSIDSAGNVLSAALQRSSGSAELDAAALALVRRATPVPAPPPGESLQTVAPITFDIR